jgi:hypothetical protein
METAVCPTSTVFKTVTIFLLLLGIGLQVYFMLRVKYESDNTKQLIQENSQKYLGIAKCKICEVCKNALVKTFLSSVCNDPDLGCDTIKC